MPCRPLSREETRSIDRLALDEFGLSTLVLMENAGRGAAELLTRSLAAPARVVIACGPGNNGGDGGVVARHLDALGYPVRVVWFADRPRLSGDAQAQAKTLERSGIAQEFLPEPVPSDRLDALFADGLWIVDALLGTGLTRPVEGVLRAAIEAMNRSGRSILALDLPSGLDADTGEPLGIAVVATETATFAAPKLGFDRAGAARFTGPVHVVSIGVPRRLLERFSPAP